MFDAKKVTEEIIAYIRDYFNKYNLKGVVLGISGGKDSAVVAGLFAKALGPKNVIGVWMPCHSKEEDKEDAKTVADHFGFDLFTIDITPVYETFKQEFKKGFKELEFNNDDLKESDINIKPRLRMLTNYYTAAFFSAYEEQGYLVPGTSNLAELFTGYFTKGGDNVCDISVIGDLTVSEVLKVGEYIGVPSKILYKTPNDGLSNMSDEEKMGILYEDVEKVINNQDLDEEIKTKIMKLHQRNAHKFSVPTYKKGG